MFNKIIVLGRITNDLVLKTTPSGVSVLSFTVACDRQFKDKEGGKKTDFFNCVAWRQEAEFISRFFGKGSAILVEGELQNRSYVDKDGNNRYITEIIISRASFTGEAKRTTQEKRAEQIAETPTQEITPQDVEAANEEYPF